MAYREQMTAKEKSTLYKARKNESIFGDEDCYKAPLI
jgi:hypothetical protein